MIRELTTYEDILSATKVMKNFEQSSNHVKVDIEHSAQAYTKMVNSGISAFFSLEYDGVCFGGLGCIKAPDLHEGTLTAIETFWFVLPEHRGKGILLFNAFEKWADKQGCKNKAMIHMADSFPETLSKFYKRKGYELAEYHFIKRGVK